MKHLYTYVYCLKHPRADKIYYVGESQDDPDTRLGHHHRAHEKTCVHKINQNLRRLGLYCIMYELEQMPVSTSKAEREHRQDFWIDTLRMAGCPILNLNREERANVARSNLSKQSHRAETARSNLSNISSEMCAHNGKINGRLNITKCHAHPNSKVAYSKNGKMRSKPIRDLKYNLDYPSKAFCAKAIGKDVSYPGKFPRRFVEII